MEYSEKFTQVMMFYVFLTYFVPVILTAMKYIKNQNEWGNVSAMMAVLSAGLWFTVGNKYANS